MHVSVCMCVLVSHLNTHDPSHMHRAACIAHKAAGRHKVGKNALLLASLLEEIVGRQACSQVLMREEPAPLGPLAVADDRVARPLLKVADDVADGLRWSGGGGCRLSGGGGQLRRLETDG